VVEVVVLADAVLGGDTVTLLSVEGLTTDNIKGASAAVAFTGGGTTTGVAPIGSGRRKLTYFSSFEFFGAGKLNGAGNAVAFRLEECPAKSDAGNNANA
jgi:hypothetical protein